jgi:hypothetical protein
LSGFGRTLTQATQVTEELPPTARLVLVQFWASHAPSTEHWSTGWQRGPFADDPEWPDVQDWSDIRDLREHYAERFAGAILQRRWHRVFTREERTATEPHLLAGEVLATDDRFETPVVLALHYALLATREEELREKQTDLSQRSVAAVERLLGTTDLADSEPVTQLLCVPRVGLLPRAKVSRPGHYPGHVEMHAVANPRSSESAYREFAPNVFPFNPWSQPKQELLVGSTMTVAVGDAFYLLEALQRTVVLDAVLAGAAQHAALRALGDEARRRAARPSDVPRARALSRDADHYQQMFSGLETGRPELDRVIRSYRTQHDLERLEASVPGWSEAGAHSMQRAGALVGALGALIGLAAAAATLVTRAGGLEGSQQLIGIPVAFAVLLVGALTPLGREVFTDLPQAFGSVPSLATRGAAGLSQRWRIVTLALVAGAALIAVLTWLVATERISAETVATYGSIVLVPVLSVAWAWWQLRKPPASRT